MFMQGKLRREPGQGPVSGVLGEQRSNRMRCVLSEAGQECS